MLFEENRGHVNVPMLHKGTELIFRFCIGIITGVTSGSGLLPGSAGAYACLIILAVLKSAYATLITLFTPNVDWFRAIGEASSEWCDVAAIICMIILQHVYMVRCCPSNNFFFSTPGGIYHYLPQQK